MHIRGVFSISRKNAITLEEIESKVVNNTVTLAWYEAFSIANFTTNWSGSYLNPPGLNNLSISISTTNVPAGQRWIEGIDGIIATADTDLVGIGSKMQFMLMDDPSFVSTMLDLNLSGIINETYALVRIRQKLGFTQSIYPSGTAYDRVFRTVALTDLAANIDHTKSGSLPLYPNGHIAGTVYAYANLGSPFTQKKDETLTLTYTLVLPKSLHLSHRKILAESMWYILGTSAGNNTASNRLYVTTVTGQYCNFPIDSDYTRFAKTPTNRPVSTDSNGGGIAVKKRGSQKYLFTYQSTANDASAIGTIYNGIGIGYTPAVYHNPRLNNIICHPAVDNFPTISPFQNLFSHSAVAVLPFQDNGNLATGSAKPILSGTNGDDLPSYYRIEITGGGAIGTATYKWQRRRMSYFAGNSFVTASNLEVPFTHQGVANNKPFPEYHARTGDMAHDIAYSKIRVLRYDDTGICIINLMNGNHIEWDANTSPALPVTLLRQVSVDKTNGYIYAACRATGLWRIIPGTSVTQLSSDPCYGVDVGFSQVFAVFDQGGTLVLRDNSSWTTNLAFTFPLSNLHTSNLTYLCFITADKSTANRIAILGSNASATTRVWWWNNGTLSNGASLTAITQTPGVSAEFNPGILVSTDTGEWYRMAKNGSSFGSYQIFFSLFGDSTSSLVLNTYPDGFYIATQGVSVMLDEHGYVLTQMGAVTRKGASRANGSRPYDRSAWRPRLTSACYMGDGMMFVNDGTTDYIVPFAQGEHNRLSANGAGIGIQQSGILNPLIWDTYGWNGTNWDLESPQWNGTAWVADTSLGSKTSHLSTDVLIEGINISFADPGTSGLTATNWYSQVVCQGVYKDTHRNLNYSYSLNLMPVKTIDSPVIVTIPSAAPHSVPIPKSNKGGSDPDGTFRFLEMDNIKDVDIQIAGYPGKANILTGLNANPGLNEILINGSNGALLFNASDQAKTAQINKYSYIASDSNRATPASPFAGVYSPVLLVRADVGVSGNPVTSWQDTSGNGLHLTASGASRPPISTDVLNGFTTVSFAASTENRLTLPVENPMNLSRGFSLIAIVKLSGTTNGVLYSYEYPGSSILSVGFADSQMYITSASVNYVLPCTLSLANWTVISLTLEPENGKVLHRINKITVNHLDTALHTHKSTRYYNIGGQYIGNRFPGVSTGANANMKGSLAFLALYDHYLVEKELAAIENAATMIFALP